MNFVIDGLRFLIRSFVVLYWYAPSPCSLAAILIRNGTGRMQFMGESFPVKPPSIDDDIVADKTTLGSSAILGITSVSLNGYYPTS